ncbi:MAG: methylated-DNA--[protein]-cysteine S-methyltransferase [Alteromonadaceae bacterium]|nr:methylated-DNA--[protein]-cysteine S-methyltransferase [Alteromonadaceae bacterium]
MLTYTGFVESKAGLIKITADNIGINEIAFVEQPNVEPHENGIVEQAKSQLSDYLARKRQQFDLPLNPRGTDFQKQVWRLLVDIPFGNTASYQDIALKLGDKNKVRAVGGANGKNPIAIVVPCHRVIGKNGTLTGYAGGLERKAFLLDIENIVH